MADVQERSSQTVEPPVFRPFAAEVVRTERLGPNFVRVTFTGPDLAAFGYAGCDQRIKVLLAAPGRTAADLPTGDDWYLRWQALPDDIRPVKRTYTLRALRPEESQVDIDFVLHGLDGEPGSAGPVSTWAARAQPGDRLALLGPDRAGQGRLWGVEWAPPAGATTLLIAGDETAVPAIGAILEALPEGVRTLVCAEIPDEADVPAWTTPPGAEVRWLVRRRAGVQAPRGELLEAAVREWLSGLVRGPAPVVDEADPVDAAPDDVLLWDIPEQPSAGADAPYVWLAGEAGVMKTLRRLARREFALPKTAVACMGYWREGAAES
jgi:NADPH-dependent ferric siderophore reductase